MEKLNVESKQSTDSEKQQSIVPWRTPEQFKKVYDYIFSEDIAKLRWAAEQMAVWEARCWPTPPLAVEVTLLLVRAKIQDMLFEADKSLLCQAREVEMMYCTALVRFVNLIVEENINQRKDIAILAEKKNIPYWIIDVRHNITHSFCPTLPVLRMTYKTIMECLEDQFWLPESERIILSKRSFPRKKYRRLLNQYRDVQLKISSNNFADHSRSKRILKAVCSRLDNLLYNPGRRRKFLEVLVHPDNFVTGKEVVMIFLKECSFLSREKNVLLPVEYKQLWIPLLKLLDEHDFIQEFLEMLLLSQAHRRIQVFQKIVDFFVVHLLSCIADPDEDTDGLFTKRKPLLNYHSLLYCCVKGSSTYSAVVFEKLSSNLEMGFWKEEISVMLSIKQGLALTKESERNDRRANKGQKKRKLDITFTVDDLDADIHEELLKRTKKSPGNRWQLTPVSTDLSKLVLGQISNPVKKEEESKQELESTSLERNEKVTPVVIEETTIDDDEEEEEEEPASFIFKTIPDYPQQVYTKRMNTKI